MRESELIFVKESRRRIFYAPLMSWLIRPLLHAALLLALVVSGPGYAGMPHGPAQATKMVICGQSGPEVLWLDAQGNPIKGGVPTQGDCAKCPECLAEAGRSMAEGGVVCLPAAPAGLSAAATILPVRVQPRALDRHLRPDPTGPPVRRPDPFAPVGLRIEADAAPAAPALRNATSEIEFYQFHGVCSQTGDGRSFKDAP